MDAKKIKKLMIDLDLSVSEIARRTGYSRGHTSRVLHGHYPSEAAEQKILSAMAAAQRERQAA